MKKLTPCLVLAFVVAVTASSSAEQMPTTVSPVETKQRATAPQVPLKVQVVVSRSLGEKKISSTPYTLSVVANDDDTARLRMGVDVPVPEPTYSKEGAPQPSFRFRSVGTNIDCRANSVEGGLFKLNLTVTNTSVFTTEKQGGEVAGSLPGVPAFRSFTSNFKVLLKDGQSAQQTAATDPITGEVLRVDVTLNVLK